MPGLDNLVAQLEIRHNIKEIGLAGYIQAALVELW